MLVKFKVQNYKNFKEPIILDFKSMHDYKFNSQCIQNELLSKIIIYGKNGSGKSNLGFAIFDIVALLTDKHTDVKQKDQNSFLNADCDDSVARFEYVFRKDSDIITYSYEKDSPNSITYEELLVNDVKVYSYDFITRESAFKNLDIIHADSLNFEYYENDLAVLRYVANNTNQPDNSIVRYIMNYVSHMLWFRSLQENGYIGYTTSIDDIHNWIINNNQVEYFQNFLKDVADIDIELETLVLTSPSRTKLLVEKHSRTPLVFENVASNGTKALEYLFYWSHRFKDVSFLFMDEFDAFYHFELARNVVKFILDYTNMQVIFTTHNSYLASNEISRPDCYFILDKGRLSSFADSTERELREGHNLEKLLRNGEFNV